MKGTGLDMLRVFIATMLLSSCSYLPSKNKKARIELQTTMDRESNIYKFCSNTGTDGNQCPTPTIKTPSDSSLDEERSEEVVQVSPNDSLLENVVDIAKNMARKEDLQLVLSLNFYFATSTLYQESLDRLNSQIFQLRDQKIILKGFTDNIGHLDRNNSLALERARAVKQILLGHGLKDEEITIEGYPLCCYLKENSTDENRKLNRRVEIYLYR